MTQRLPAKLIIRHRGLCHQIVMTLFSLHPDSLAVLQIFRCK